MGENRREEKSREREVKMAIAIPFAPKRAENEDRTHAHSDGCQPCIVCGRKVRKPRHMVHVHDGGATIVTEAESLLMDSSADLGLYPIGSDCLRTNPEIKPYVKKRVPIVAG